MQLTERVGALTWPIAASADASFAPLDTARTTLLGLFTAAINTELAARWLDASNAVGKPFIGTQPVQDTLELEPSPTVMAERKTQFPLLALYRDGEAKWDQWAIDEYRAVQTWGLTYILGPLDTAALRRLGTICDAIPKLVGAVIRNRGHAAFRGGALQFFDAATGGLGRVELKTWVGPAQAKFDDSPTIYYACTMVLETHEYEYETLSAYPALAGVDVTVDESNGTDVPFEVIVDGVDF